MSMYNLFRCLLAHTVYEFFNIDLFTKEYLNSIVESEHVRYVMEILGEILENARVICFRVICPGLLKALRD